MEMRWRKEVEVKKGSRASSTFSLNFLLAIAIAFGLLLASFAEVPTISLTAKHYVTNGLAFHLDGIENGGYGTHVDSPVELIDLAQKKAVTLGESESVTFNSFYLAAAHSVANVFSEIPDGIALESFVKPADLTTTSSDMAYLGAANRASFSFDARVTSALVVIYKKAAVSASSSVNRFWSRPVHPFANSTTITADATPAYRYSGNFSTGVPAFYVNETSVSVPASFWEGGSCTDSKSVFIGHASAPSTFHSVRVYSRQLSSSERTWNANVDKVRFEGATAASLDWPQNMRIVDGEVQGGVRVTCGAEKGTIAVNGGGASAVTNAWPTLGETVTVAATPVAGYIFGGWRGDVPSGCDVSSPTISFAFDVPRTLTAYFRGIQYVSTTGTDTSAHSTPATPYRTIQHALDNSEAGDWIYVAGGIYDESVVSSVVQMKLVGSWNEDFTSRDLKNSRTVIRSTSKSKDVFKVTVVSNSVSGVDFTGGSIGFNSGGGVRSNTSSVRATMHHLIECCVISNNTYGVQQLSFYNVAVLSSLVVGNTVGHYENFDTGGFGYYLNTTFADNATALKREQSYSAPYVFRNCLFLRNTTVFHLTSGSGSSISLYNNCYADNGEILKTWGRYTDGDAKDDQRFIFYGDFLCGAASLDSDWKPAADSIAAGSGADLSSSAEEPVTVDLYGTAWNGGWDCGCVKSGAVAPTLVSEVYVSPDGDDVQSGTSAAQPKRTLAFALRILAENGVLHVADGTYTGINVIHRKGISVLGESRDGVIVRASESALSNTRPDAAFSVVAHDAVISNVTVTGSAYGIRQQSYTIARNLCVVDAVLKGNRHGMWFASDHTTAYRDRMSRCQVRDNLGHGLFFSAGILIDNSLFADNGWCGCYFSSWDTDGGGDWYQNNISLTHCTLTGNGTYGFLQPSASYIGGWSAVNCIFEGNVTAGVGGTSSSKLLTCCFWNNGTDVSATRGTPVQYASLFADPLLDTTATLRGHLLDDSPCSQTGTNVATRVRYKPAVSNDLDGVKRLVDKPDIGCFDSPETIESLAGDGYHIVNVEGDPNGYGEPNPTYGRHLTKDGATTLDVACTLATDPIDGRRRYLISEGVRARYVGYELIRSDDQEVLKASDADESCAFTLGTNVTFSVKWVVEDLITVSSGKSGCTVSVNGCTPAETLQVWVTNGAPVTVTIIPSDDWAHSQWTGDVPTSVDAKEMTIVWTSDRPRTMTPSLRGVHYVCLTGSDANDGTKAHPWRTISYAVIDSRTVDGDEIKVQGGLYEECVTNLIGKGGVGHLTLSGSWNADWERDLRNARTIVTPPASLRFKEPCLTMNTGTNTVIGFDFTGGSAGVKSTSNYGGAESTVDHHELVYLICTNNTTGVEFVSSKQGAALICSLLADNTTYGFDRSQDRGARDYVYNCTFARNGTALARRHYFTPTLSVVNCVFSENGQNVYTAIGDYSESYSYCCFGAATTTQFRGKTLSADTWRRMGFYTGTMTANPLLDKQCAPTAASPFIARGKNIVANSIYSFGTDVYGTLWDGVWDMGCIKSTFEPVATHDEQYVSATGDDTNDGLTEATAKRTIGNGVACLNKSGTVHVGPGVYGPTAIPTHGAKVVGAGPGLSIVTQSGEGGRNAYQMSGFEILATNVVVEGFTVTNCVAGACVAAYTQAQNPTFRNCEFTQNFYGIYGCGGANTRYVADGHYITVDRCKVTDNGDSGLWLGEPAYATSTLVARNGRDGFRTATGDCYNWSIAVHCSVLHNKRYGVYNTDGWAGGMNFWNSVIAGNSVGAHRWNTSYSGGIALYYTVMDNAQNYYALNGSGGRVFVNAGTVETDPMIITNGLHYGHLRRRSNCLGAGSTSPSLKPAYDLAGRPLTYKKQSRVDCGCYRRDPTPLTIMVR